MLCLGFKEEMFACLLQSHGETIKGKGNAVFCPCFSFLFPLVVSPLHGTNFIKMKSEFVRICGFSDLMALPSVDFLTPLPLCLFLRIFKQNFLPCSYLCRF